MEEEKILREELARRLTEERERLGYSLRNFSRQLGISEAGLRNYESGLRGINAEVLARAAAWGVDVQYILTGIHSPNKPEAEKAATSNIGIHTTSGANVVGIVQSGATVNQIQTKSHKTVVKADVKPGLEHITEGQAARLTDLVKQICELESKLKKKPQSFRSVWYSLNSHMGVTKYRLIPIDDFNRAEKYLLMWIGRLTSMKSAPVEDGDNWRKRKYAYIKINTKSAIENEKLAFYIKRNFGANSLTELANDELEQVYKYVAGRRSRGR